MPQPGLVFFGSPPLAGELLEALAGKNFSIVAVVTQPDKPVGRQQVLQPTAVADVAARLGLRCYKPVHVRRLASELQPMQPVAGVLFSYGRILPRALLDIFPLGILNLHPSLLPRYRGPSPVSGAILDGQTETGVSIIRLDEQLDHGPVVAQRVVAIGPDENADALLSRLLREGTDLLVSILPDYLAQKITPRPQDETRASYTKSIYRENGRIDWTLPADAIVRQSRAYHPWPGVFTTWRGTRIKLFDLQPTAPGKPLPAGTVIIGDRISVACGNGAVVVGRMQQEGKTAIASAVFLRGHPSLAGSRLT